MRRHQVTRSARKVRRFFAALALLGLLATACGDDSGSSDAATTTTEASTTTTTSEPEGEEATSDRAEACFAGRQNGQLHA